MPITAFETKTISAFQPGLVSVIIPTYNRSQLVQDAIRSALAQSWRDIQVIVVDDGSTDGTLEELTKFESITLLKQEHSGQIAARNLGLSHALGEFVCTLDSDDFWHPEFLERCISALKLLNADFVFANWRAESVDKKLAMSYFEQFYHWWDFPETGYEDWRMMLPLQARAMFLDSCVCPSSGLVFKREAFSHGWTSGLNIADDWCLILDSLLARPLHVAFCMDHLWVKRSCGDNIYDGRELQVLDELLWYQDCWFLYERLRLRLSRLERAKMSRRLVNSSLKLARSSWRKDKRLALPYALATGVALLNVALNDPLFLAQKAVNRVRARAIRLQRHESSAGLFIANE